MRGLMPDDEDHLNWRMEPLGWDKEDRAYFVLDDNRLYRRTDEPPPPLSPKPRAKSKAKPPSAKKSKSKPTRSSKRRKIEETSDEEVEEPGEDAQPGAAQGEDTTMMDGDETVIDEELGFGFTSKTWECIAITLDDYQEFMATIFRSRDPNEKQLRKRLEETVIPIIEKREEAIKLKQSKKLRELENLQKMTYAKRSSRLADKADKEKEERELREIEEKRHRDLKMAHEEEERQQSIQEVSHRDMLTSDGGGITVFCLLMQGHESRRLTREQRVKEREVKRILHEEKLAQLDEQEARAVSQDANSESIEAKRISERQTKSQKEQLQKELAKLADEDGTWIFDCAVCGLHGENLDDGTHSLACDECGVWQHSKCYGFSPKQAEKNNFSFVCKTCDRKQAEANRPKTPKLKLTNKRPSDSPNIHNSEVGPSTANKPKENGLPEHIQQQLDRPSPTPRHHASPGPYGLLTNGPSLSPYGQLPNQSGLPPVANFAPPPPQQPWQGHHYPTPQRPPSSGYASSPPPPTANGYGAPHYQQHQYAHQQAVQASGAHPSYPQYHYSPHTSAVVHPAVQSPPQHYYGQAQYSQQPQALRRPSDAHTNGLGTPAQGSRLQHPQTPQPPVLSQSPSASFPPPTAQPNPSQSPVKSSPPHPPTGTSINGHAPSLTPRPDVVSTPRTGNGIVADGMCGPWPEGSQAIPQKKSQV